MHLLGLEIRKDRREKQYSMKNCFDCGKTIWVAQAKIRVYNYCGNCK